MGLVLFGFLHVKVKFWSQQGDKLVGTGILGSEAFQGYSVALNGLGDTLAVGGNGDNAGDGATWIFVKDITTGIWSQQGKKLIGAGSKGGIFYTFDRTNGNLIWSTIVCPGGTLGGMEFGSATDGRYIYVSATDSSSKIYSLPNGTQFCGGIYAALDIDTGNLVWVTPVPGTIYNLTQCVVLQNAHSTKGLPLFAGAVTVGNGIVYVGSSLGQYYGLDKNTGQIIWSYQPNATVGIGGTVVGDSLYWGTGSSSAPGNGIFAFSLP